MRKQPDKRGRGSKSKKREKESRRQGHKRRQQRERLRESFGEKRVSKNKRSLATERGPSVLSLMMPRTLALTNDDRALLMAMLMVLNAMALS